MPLRSSRVPALAFALSAAAPVFAPVGGFAQSAAATPDSLSAWHLSPAAIDSSCRAAITSAREAIAASVARQPGDRTFDNTLRPVENAVATLVRVTGPETFLYQVSPDSAVRDSSRDCSQRVAHYMVELATDPQTYATAIQIRDHGLASSQADRQLVQIYIENGRRSGAGLDSATRARVTGLFQRLNDIQRDYLIALNRDSSAITIAPADTVGLPAQFRAGLTPTADGFVVKVNESTYPQYMQNERSAEARKRFALAYFNRGGQENVDRLRHALVLRDSLAHLLGFPTWAAYQLDGKMAKDPKRVISFLDTVDGRLVARAREEVARLAPLARRDGVAVPLAWSDYSYYNEKYRRAHYAVSTEVVRQYFPVDYVVRAVLDIYQQLFGVRFAEITPADAWAPDVRAFSVTDAATGSHLGRFYLDLFPRPNKYDHFADFTPQAACELPNGSRALPVTAIVGNWPLGEPGKPALLSHSDVVTFFHEFGHAMAAVLDGSPYVTTGSQNYRQDFVEAPSQMLENWMWQPAILKRVSHNVVTGRPLPDSLITRMIALKHMNDGVSWTFQAFLASYDMTLHTSPPTIDPSATWADLFPRMTAFPMPPGVIPAAGFGHLMGGYDAGYYGYLWSRVYAQDMFTRFEREGALNARTGLAYRSDVLATAATREPDVSLRSFLGRPLSYDAFYRDVGISGPHQAQ